MTIFRNYTFSWRQIGILKLTVVCIGLAAGAYWSDFFGQYLLGLLAIAIIGAVYLVYVTFGK